MKDYLKSNITPIVIIVFSMIAIGAWKGFKNEVIVWRFNNLQTIGEAHPSVWGNPKLDTEGDMSSISFDGYDDALLFDRIPIEGWQEFTIEVLIQPDADGPIAPRFMHFEDVDLNRGTMEMRITKKGMWYLDSFLKNGDPAKSKDRLALIDSSLLHPCNQWYWVAMSYDNGLMKSYVNGKPELEGSLQMPPFKKGNLSVGVRLNKVNWFKGKISEIRFHPLALDAAALQQLR